MINKLKQLFDGELPGETSHQMMMPVNRPLSSLALAEAPVYRQSGVAILLYEKYDELYSVLIERTVFQGNPHSGQVSFPGGTMSHNDPSTEYTARRECCEEINVCLHEDDRIGELTPVFIPVSSFKVDPYVFYIDKEPEFKPDEREVNDVIQFPLSALFEDSSIRSTEMYLEQTKKPSRIPYFDVNGHIVWGATAMMLSELRVLFKKID